MSHTATETLSYTVTFWREKATCSANVIPTPPLKASLWGVPPRLSRSPHPGGYRGNIKASIIRSRVVSFPVEGAPPPKKASQSDENKEGVWVDGKRERGARRREMNNKQLALRTVKNSQSVETESHKVGGALGEKRSGVVYCGLMNWLATVCACDLFSWTGSQIFNSVPV